MKKKLLVLLAGILLIGSNAFAADGDFIVEGKVGIGTTTPEYRLAVQGAVSDGLAVLNQYGNAVTIFDRNAAGEGRFRLFDYSGTTALISFVAGGAGFFKATGVVFMDNSGNSIFRVDPDAGSSYFENGNVGIGTTNPGSKLEVNGNVEANGFTINGIPVGTSTDTYWSESNGNIYFNSGNVGIGTTSPGQKLDVEGWIEVNPGIIRGGSRVSFASNEIYFNSGGSSAERMRIDGSGNVGIGTTTPTAKLDVNGTTGYDQLRMRQTYTPTGTNDANGNEGDVSWDDNYVYVKTSAGWKRSSLSTW